MNSPTVASPSESSPDSISSAKSNVQLLQHAQQLQHNSHQLQLSGKNPQHATAMLSTQHLFAAAAAPPAPGNFAPPAGFMAAPGDYYSTYGQFAAPPHPWTSGIRTAGAASAFLTGRCMLISADYIEALFGPLVPVDQCGPMQQTSVKLVNETVHIGSRGCACMLPAAKHMICLV